MLWPVSIQPTWCHCRTSIILAINMFVVYKCGLAQRSDCKSKEDKLSSSGQIRIHIHMHWCTHCMHHNYGKAKMQIRCCSQNRHSISCLHSWTMQRVLWLLLEKIYLDITRKHHARYENVKFSIIIHKFFELHSSISFPYLQSSWVWLPHLYSWRTGKSALNSLITKLYCQPSRLESVIYTYNIMLYDILQ